MNDEAGIRYGDVWRQITQARLHIIVAVLVAMALAFVVSIVVPPSYEAVMLVRIGQMSEPKHAPVALEMPKTVLDRLHNPSFKNRVVTRVFGVKHTRKLWIRAQSLLNSNVVEIKVRGGSVTEANQIAKAVLDELKLSHQSIASTFMSVLRDDLDDVSESLKAASIQQSRAFKSISTATSLGSQSGILLSLLTEYLQSEISALRDRQAALRRSLEFPFTYMTDTIEPIYVDAEPVAPNMALNMVLAAFAALLLSVLVIVARWRE